MRKFLCLALFAAAAGFSPGQTANKVAQDCDIQFSFGGSGQRSPITGCAQNAQGIVDWRLTYTSNGFSALSIEIQDAPDSNGIPGSWVNWAGTIVDGTNPTTNPAQGTTRVGGYYPWVSVLLASVSGSGTVTGHLYGCKLPGCSDLQLGSGGGGGGCTAPCVVIGPDAPGAAPTQSPVQDSGFDGTDVQRLRTDTTGRLSEGAYPLSVSIALSSSGTTKVITHVTGITTIAQVLLSVSGGVTTLTYEYGTGTNCGTGTSSLGSFLSVAAFADDKPFVIPAGNDFCLGIGAGVTVSGMVKYAQ